MGHDYGSNRWTFVTVVTAGRESLFGRIEGCEFIPSALGRLVEEEIAALPERRAGVVVAVHAIMPNHVHLLVGLATDDADHTDVARRFEAPKGHTLSAVIGTWKAGVRRRAGVTGLWGAEELWQRRFHDRVVRNAEEWNGIAEYILWNPVMWHHDPLNGAVEPTVEELREWKRRNDL